MNVFVIILTAFLCFVIWQIRQNRQLNVQQIPEKQANINFSSDINVVATMQDAISVDTVWCGTFQLIWNDLIKELVKQEIHFEEPFDIVEHLNKQEFDENSISDEYYYKKWGKKTLDLKKEIETGIEQKFHEKSDVLENIDWSEEALDRETLERYLFYVMLKRSFSYEKEFSELDNGKFGNQYENIKYFGIDNSTKEDVRKQVEVLYYDSQKTCAVQLNTQEGDVIILGKGIEGTTFQEIFDNMQKKSEIYSGEKEFLKADYLRIPEISFQVKKEYQELQNKGFYTYDNQELIIDKAIQTIQLKLDKTGGSIKSEAVMEIECLSAMMEEETKPRYFNFDEEYVIFLIEKEKDKPYFAMKIKDITKFQ